jgi:uncharacterized membrane protein
MKLRSATLVCAVLIAAMVDVGAFGYLHLPSNALVAVHFGLSGQPDGFAPKAIGLSIMPTAAAILTAFLLALPRFAANKEGLQASALPYGVGMIAVTLLLALCQVALVGRALNESFDVARTIALAFALLGLMLGNFLGKARRNHFFGVRTPWTLTDERVWDKTHRFTGRLVFVGGLMLLAAVIAAPSAPQLLLAVIACAIGPWIAGAVYSGVIFPRRGRA